VGEGPFPAAPGRRPDRRARPARGEGGAPDRPCRLRAMDGRLSPRRGWPGSSPPRALSSVRSA